MHPREADLEALIKALVEGGVKFIVVGGAAAVLHGAPTTTQVLDIVPELSDKNISRLHQVLVSLDAYVRELSDRKLRPTKDHLAAAGQINLSTILGPLDPLGRLHDGRGFEDLLSRSITLTDGELEIRVIDLPTLIEIKSQTGRAKDSLVVPILVSMLREQDP